MQDDNVSLSHSVLSTRTGTMCHEEQDERRKQIREIMGNSSLSQMEKNRSIQSLMDGRSRRGSTGTRSHTSSYDDPVSASYNFGVTSTAGHASGYISYSDHEGDMIMEDTPEDICYGYGRYDERSVASSVTQTSHYSVQDFVPGTYRQLHGRSYSLQDWTDADRITAAANTSIFTDNPLQVAKLMEHSRPHCEHYERQCTIVSPCCGLAFGCRICHDECPVLPPPRKPRSSDNEDQMMFGNMDSKKRSVHQRMDRRRSMPIDLEEEESHHAINRFAIAEVICRHCYCRQSSKTNNCVQCGIQFGEYHCNICNLWMSAIESPYHCHDCGFCRVGGRDNFKHCNSCGMCIDALLFDNHNCKTGRYMSNCPICQEDLFSSRDASHEMPCGHAIHWHCFKQLTSFDTRCPVCKKTAETPEQMASTWSAIAMGIALQPVPPELARVVHLLCYDCEKHDTNRRWHFLGVRCNFCLSFNTNVEQIVMQGRQAAEFLDELDAQRTGSTGVPLNISMPTLRADFDEAMEEETPGAQDTSSGSTDGHF